MRLKRIFFKEKGVTDLFFFIIYGQGKFKKHTCCYGGA